MSSKNDQSHTYDIRSGLAMFDANLLHRVSLDGDEKLSQTTPPSRKVSSSSSVGPSQSSPSPTYSRPVGSNR